jgi:ATP-dependent protease ClpP protease subunit
MSRLRMARPVNLVTKGKLDWYRILDTADGTEIHIYDEIGYFGVQAKTFIDELNSIDTRSVTLRLNTPGGEVFDGIAIYNALMAHPAKVNVHIDALAASIGSVIAMAGDTITMSAAATMMIHDGFAMQVGNAADMRKTAEVLDKTSDNLAQIYAARTGTDAAVWRERMLAESWYTADECVELGLADKVTPRKAKPGDEEDMPIAAQWNLSIYKQYDASVDSTPWDGGAAMSAAADSENPASAYKAICAGRRAGDPSKQSSWALPHHKHPGDAPNAAGVRNALARLSQTQGLTNAEAARAHLEAHMSAIGSGDGESSNHTHDDVWAEFDPEAFREAMREAQK